MSRRSFPLFRCLVALLVVAALWANGVQDAGMTEIADSASGVMLVLDIDGDSDDQDDRSAVCSSCDPAIPVATPSRYPRNLYTRFETGYLPPPDHPPPESV